MPAIQPTTSAKRLLLETVCNRLAEIAPLKLAEDWDNVGLLVGDRRAPIERIMTCLTVTPAVVEEAIERKIDLIVTHHPLPFKPLAKITSDTIAGKILLRLIAANTAIYSAHTAFDTALEGINAAWANALGLQNVASLVDPNPNASESIASAVGAGRYGNLSAPSTLADLAVKAGAFVRSNFIQITTPADLPVSRVGIACGSGGSFLRSAVRLGCNAMITGEATFHTCLEAQALGVGLILTGHFASERFAMEHLAEKLAIDFPIASVVASQADTDPMLALRC